MGTWRGQAPHRWHLLLPNILTPIIVTTVLNIAYHTLAMGLWTTWGSAWWPDIAA